MHERANSKLPFWGHVYILRSYVLGCAAVFFVCAILVFLYGEVVLTRYLLGPLQGQQLVFLSPLGPFLFKVKISFVGAVVFSFPVWLLMAWRFVAEALPSRKRMFLLGLVGAAGALAATSVIIAYGYLVPTSLSVLSNFVVPGTSLMISAESYTDFLLLCVVSTLVILELPLLLVALSYLRLINPYAVAQRRRILFIGLLITIAMLTPTMDAITLLMVTIPGALFTEMGIAIAKVMYTEDEA